MSSHATSTGTESYRRESSLSGNNQNSTTNRPAGSSSKKNSTADVKDLLEEEPKSGGLDITGVLLQFVKIFVIIFPVYVLGYFGLSFSWVLIGLVVFFWWRRNRGNKNSRLYRALAFLDHEENSVRQSIHSTDLPPWVHFPDVERVEWLNKLNGTMRVILEPLIGDMPIIGAVSLFFLRKPLLDINWTGITNILDIPGLNGLSDTVISDIICNYLVLPNRITVPLVGDVQLAQLRFPMPKGVLRIHFLEAQDLIGKDTFLKGIIKGKSDPYAVIQVGRYLFQTKTIKENLNPKWKEVFEALVYENPGQQLEVELFDEDPDKDDFLGSLMIDLAEVHKEQSVDEWFVLDEVATGKLHLKLEWLTLLPTPEKLDQVLASIKADKGQANDGLSSSLLIIYLDSARSLPILSLESQQKSGQPSLVQVKKSPNFTKDGKKAQPTVSGKTDSNLPATASTSSVDINRKPESYENPGASSSSPQRLVDLNKSSSNLNIASYPGSPIHLSAKEATPSIASDISHPYATQELRQRLRHLQNGTAPPHMPLGQVQLTVRHSSQRNRLIVVVHACRNLIAFSEAGSDPYIRMYLLPDKRRSGRRKTAVVKKTLNPVYDETFDFSVSLIEVHRRTLDVAVKNSGGFLSKDKGLLGKVLIDLTSEDINKGWTQW
ncbi:UNVERIFIED_CONTAM: hypothetical protein FKN15_028478 [Acipenser sinensis]